MKYTRQYSPCAQLKWPAQPIRRGSSPVRHMRLLLLTALGILALSSRAIAQKELYVADFDFGTITRMNLDGTGATVIVTGLSTPEDGVCGKDGTLYFPENAFDVDGVNVFGRIRKFDRTGAGLATIFDGSQPSSPSLRPEGLSISPSGTLFFNTRSASNGAVWMFSSASGPPVQATAIFTQFGEGSTFKANGNFLAAARSEGKIFEFTPPFNSTNAGSVFASGLSAPFGIAVNSTGDVFVCVGGGAIKRFSSSGTLLGTFTQLAGPALFLEIDDDDNLYATSGSSVVKIAPNGSQTIIANSFSFALGLPLCRVREARIDIKPGSDPNSINCNNLNEVIAVAILSTSDFDATSVNHETVTFGPGGAKEIHSNKQGLKRHESDVNGDGRTDLVLHFRLGDTEIQCGMTEAVLKGQTFDGRSFQGTDAIRTVGGGNQSAATLGMTMSKDGRLSFDLEQNYPNPFNPSTRIQYDVAEPTLVSLKVYDMLGREVATLVQDHRAAGRHTVQFTADQLPSGSYLYRITAGTFTQTKRMVLMK